MAITVVQSKTINATTTSPATLTFTSSVTAGNTVIVCVSNRNTADSNLFATPTDNKGNTYHSAGSEIANPFGDAAIAQFYAYNVSGGSSFTISDVIESFCCCGSPIGSTLSITAYEVSGLSTSNPLDLVHTGNGTSTTPASGSTGTTSQANELLVGQTATSANETLTAGSGYSNLSTQSSTNLSSAGETQIVSSTGTYAATFSQSGSHSWACAIVTYKAALAPIASTGALSFSFGLSGITGVLGTGSVAGHFTASGTGTVKIPATGSLSFHFTSSVSGGVKLVSTGALSYHFTGGATGGHVVNKTDWKFNLRGFGQVVVPPPSSQGVITCYAYSFGQPFTLLNELPLKDVKWSQRLNTEGNFTGSLNLADELVIAMGGPVNTLVNKTLIVVDVDGQIAIAGLLVRNPYDSSTKLMALTASEAWVYFTMIRQAFDYSVGPNGGSGVFWAGNPDYAHNIAAQVIFDALSLVGFAMPEMAIVFDIESPVTPNPTTASYPAASAQMVDQIVTQLAQSGFLTGFDFAMDWVWLNGPGSTPAPIVTLSFPARERSVAETELVVDLQGENVKYTWDADGTEQANDILGTGAAQNTLISEQKVDPSDSYDLFQGTYSPQNINTQPGLDSATEGQLAISEFPPITAVITMPIFSESGLSLNDFRLGDDMRVVGGKDERWPEGIDVTLRCIGIDATVPDNGNPTMALTMTMPATEAPATPPPYPS